jgi:HTH-type transcriptional regulator/antitoxin HipB
MDYAIQTPQQLSAHLRALRKARGLSQAALGEALGVGQTRVARIEGNPTAVSVEQLIEVLGALGVQLVLRDVTVQRQVGGQVPKAARGAPKRAQAGGDW